MTIYSDYSEASDYSEPIDDGCCCAPEAAGTEDAFSNGWDEYPSDDVIVDDYSGNDDSVAPTVYEPPAPEASAVIPAGQPGGPEVVPVPMEPAAVIPAGQPGGPDWQAAGAQDLYPSVGTIGGNDFGAMTITPGDDATPSFGQALGTIGGYDSGAITISAGDGTSPSFGPSFATIDPSGNSSLDALGALYGFAEGKGNVLSQVLLNQTVNSTQGATAPWVSPYL